MAARKPATAAEITAILRQNKRIATGKALPFRDALEILHAKLDVDLATASDWLSKATVDASHPFELIGSTHAGRVYDVARAPDNLNLHEAGYAGENSEMWPYLTAGGTHVSHGDEGASDREFVILPEALRAMCVKTEKQARLRDKAEKNNRAMEIAGAEDKHGASLAYIRGLMKMVDPDDTQVDRPLHNLKTGATSITLGFGDDAIERLAEVLAAHDIEPDPPTQMITRKPLPEATE
jgi:hypothetical protein